MRKGLISRFWPPLSTLLRPPSPSQSAGPDSEMNSGKEFIDIVSLFHSVTMEKKTLPPCPPFFSPNLFVTVTAFLHFCNPSYQTWRN